MSDKMNFYEGLENQLENKEIVRDLEELKEILNYPYLEDYLKERLESRKLTEKKNNFLNQFKNLNHKERLSYRNYVSTIMKNDPGLITDFDDDIQQVADLLKSMDKLEIFAGICNNCDPNNDEPIINNNQEHLEENFPKFEIDSKSVEARINGHDYKIWNENDISEIKKIGDDEYQIDLKVHRRQNKLVNYSRDIELKFTFENDEIVFFNDRNNNDNYDTNEYARKYEVETDEVTKIINQPNGNKIILKDGLSYNISLDKKHISTPGVDNIKFTIKF